MLEVAISIKLFHFNELSATAKQKAIEDQRDFELSIMTPEDFISGDPEYDTPEELAKAYRSQYEYYENDDTPIVEAIEANDYLFFDSGELAHTVTYCGNHPMSGETHFIFQGHDYKVA